MRGVGFAVVVGLAACGLAWGLGGGLAGTASAATPKVGQPAPNFTVTTFGGRTVKLEELRGNVIILNFWATWCAPCRVELPFLEEVFQRYNKFGFQVLAVTTEGSVAPRLLKPLAATLTMPLVKSIKGPYRELKGVPTNYIIDRSGTLVYAKAGAIDIDDFNAIVVPLLRQPMPPAPEPPAQSEAAAP